MAKPRIYCAKATMILRRCTVDGASSTSDRLWKTRDEMQATSI